MCPVTQFYPTLYHPVDYSLPDSSVRGILWARVLEWVAVSFSRWSFQPRDQTHVSSVSWFCKWIVYQCTTWEALECAWMFSQSCLTLQPRDCSPPGSSVHGILQVSILEWVALSSPEELPKPWIKPRSPALQADSLPAEPSGKPLAPSKWGIKSFIVQIFCLLTQVIKLNKYKIYVLNILLFYIPHACLVTHYVEPFAILWTVACQAPLFMGFSKQKYWSGLPFPPLEDLPNQG